MRLVVTAFEGNVYGMCIYTKWSGYALQSMAIWNFQRL